MSYLVKSSSEKMPAKCKGQYRRVAVLEVQDGVQDVSMISLRARGVVSIVREWRALSVGSTERCAFRRALAMSLNAGLGG